MEDAIKESLQAFSEQQSLPNKLHSTKYNKSNSFTQLSDWSNKHRYLNESIILPRIIQDQNTQRLTARRLVQSQTSDYTNITSARKNVPTSIKSVDIKFGLPNGLKGFQKSFYENYLKQKSQRKGSRIKPSQYISIQEQLKIRQIQKSTNQVKNQQQAARNSIINRVMNRKNRLKRQHFLQEYLIANSMTGGSKVDNENSIQINQKQLDLSLTKNKQRQKTQSKQKDKDKGKDIGKIKVKGKNKNKSNQIKKQNENEK